MTNTTEQTPLLVEGRDEDESARIFAIKEAADCTLDEAESFFDDSDWYAYTDEEADKRCQEYIADSLWAFDAGFIVQNAANYSDLTGIESAEAVESIKRIQADGACESLNGVIKLIIGDLGDFTTEAIKADGRGHFLSQYDGEEHTATINGTTYYVYQAN